MRKDYERLFTHLTPPEPPIGLFETVMGRIRHEQRLSLVRRRIFIFSVILLVSLPASIFSFQMLQTGLAKSGFSTFLSLLLSDSSEVMVFWQSFVLALLESLPALSIALFLAAALTFLESVKILVQNIKIIFTPLNNL